MELAPLTDAQLADYDRDGFVVLGRILDDDQIKALLAAEEQHRPEAPFSAQGKPSKLLVRDQLCNQSIAVREFCMRGAHIAVLTQLLGPDVAFTHTQFIAKLPDDAADTDDGAADDDASPSWIPLHQDDGYGRLDPPLDITVWTALTDTNEDNGCLVVVPGSHKQGVLDHEKVASNPALRQAQGDGAVPVLLAAGEAVAFSGMTLHGSGPNRTDATRIGMHARYCHPGVRMAIDGDKPVLEDAHSWMVAGEAPADAWATANREFLDS